MEGWSIVHALETLGGQLAGLTLFALLFVLFPIIAAPVLRSRWSLAAVYLGLIVRIVLCVLAFLGWFNVPIADSVSFQREAFGFYHGTLPIHLQVAASTNWSIFLSLFFVPFGPSILLSYALGLFGYAAATLALARLVRTLGLARWQTPILFVFCFLPGHLLLINYNYREPFQVLFLVLMVTELVKYRTSRGVTPAAMAVVFAYLFAWTHGRYLLVMPGLLAVGFLAPRFFTRQPLTWQTIVALPAAVAGLLALTLVSNSSGFAANVREDGLLGYAAGTANNVRMVQARTAFPIVIKSASPVEALGKAPALLVQFIGAPIFPMMVKQPVDVIPAVDTLVRLMCLGGVASILMSRRFDPRLRDFAAFGLVIYLTFCVASMLGTYNVGTQMRHQLKIDWILLIAAAPALLQVRAVSRVSVRATSHQQTARRDRTGSVVR